MKRLFLVELESKAEAIFLKTFIQSSNIDCPQIRVFVKYFKKTTEQLDNNLQEDCNTIPSLVESH